MTHINWKQNTWVKKLIVGFICIMLFFTIFSRIIHKQTTATVTLTSPEYGKITHTVEGTGTVSATEQETLILPEGIIVKQYYCSEGQSVEKDSPLVQMDLSSLKAKIDEYRDEIKKMQLQNQELQEQYETQKLQKEQDYERARDNYKDVENTQQNNVDRLKAARDAAAQKLAQAQQEQESSGDTLSELENEVSEAEKEYQDSLLTQKESLKEAKQNLEDSEVTVEKSTQIQQNEIVIDQYETKCSELEKILNQNGIVSADAAGVVTKLSIQEGEFTTGAAALMLARNDDDLVLVADFPKEDSKYLKAGTDVDVSVSGINRENESLKNLTIQSISESTEDGDSVQVTMTLPEGELELGEYVTLSLEAESKNYDNCIEKSVLHQDGDNDYYVYIVEESDTILGKQNIARREKVTLLDSDHQMAAVDGIFSGQKIVLESTRVLNDKNPVNIQE